jgi:ATP-dependent protease ClpP protease subunit
LAAKMHRLLAVVTPLWLMLILARPWGALASASEHARAALTSQGWTLSCDQAPRSDTKAHPCLLTVRLRGEINLTRLHLVQRAVRRRDDARRALRRDVRIRVDVDSQGGQVFAAMEIGRILHSEAASISVAKGASCLSACVFVLMGAPERSVVDGAHIGIHRPALGNARSDALVDAMSTSIVEYAAQMRVSRAIVSDMMAIPAGRMRFLTIAELDGYGIRVGTR